MRKSLFVVLFCCISPFVISQTITDATKISLLTGSPGSELYATFGHSAIRVNDPLQNLDIVFNYGTFDFDTPNFYVKFVRGQLAYKLSKEEFEYFIPPYAYDNRSMIEQQLNLTLVQKRKLVSLLLENYKPENRYYKYDFFFDNCSSRIRDIMLTAFGDDFQYHYPEDWKNSSLTFRNLIDLYLTNHHWSDFGIDIALGLPTDDIASPSDYMFLPDYLSAGFDLATIVHDGKAIPLILNTKTILNRKDLEPEVHFITPGKLTWSMFIISVALSFMSFKRKINIRWFDGMYFSLIGIVGWVVFLLWFFTDHIATKDNLNVLWAVPFHFPVFILWSKISEKVRRWYIWIFGAIDLCILIFWYIFPQNYHFAFIPLILIMLMRFILMLKVEDRKPI
jgi:hypothetical protein